MPIDLTKLAPAPWFVNYSETTDDRGDGPACLSIGPYEEDGADAFMFSETFSASDGSPDRIDAIFEFAALARNAFDVMIRRGWHTWPLDDGTWEVGSGDGRWWVETIPSVLSWPDPFTALVAADQWYRENIEKETAPCSPATS